MLDRAMNLLQDARFNVWECVPTQRVSECFSHIKRERICDLMTRAFRLQRRKIIAGSFLPFFRKQNHREYIQSFQWSMLFRIVLYLFYIIYHARERQTILPAEVLSKYEVWKLTFSTSPSLAITATQTCNSPQRKNKSDYTDLDDRSFLLVLDETHDSCKTSPCYSNLLVLSPETTFVDIIFCLCTKVAFKYCMPLTIPPLSVSDVHLGITNAGKQPWKRLSARSRCQLLSPF